MKSITLQNSPCTTHWGGLIKEIQMTQTSSFPSKEMAGHKKSSVFYGQAQLVGQSPR